jgi:hypothetical protein
VTTYQSFWDTYQTLPESERVYYELIREGAPCKLYFDLEFSRAYNDGKDVERMMRTFKKLVFAQLESTFRIWFNTEAVLGSFSRKPGKKAYETTTPTTTNNNNNDNNNNNNNNNHLQNLIIDLSASTLTKFSRHLIIDLPRYVWANNAEVGVFVSVLCGNIRGRILDLRSKKERWEKERREKQDTLVELKGNGKRKWDEGEGEGDFSKDDDFVVRSTSFSRDVRDGAGDSLESDKMDEEMIEVEKIQEVSGVNGGACDFREDQELAELEELLVYDDKGNLDLFVDEGVYSRNRNFRIYLSTKIGKTNPLVVWQPPSVVVVDDDDDGLAKKSSRDTQEQNEVQNQQQQQQNVHQQKQEQGQPMMDDFEFFLKTLVCSVTWSPGLKLLSMSSPSPSSSSKSHPFSSSSSSLSSSGKIPWLKPYGGSLDPIASSKAFGWSRSGVTPTYAHGRRPTVKKSTTRFPWLDEFILHWINNNKNAHGFMMSSDANDVSKGTAEIKSVLEFSSSGGSFFY